MKRLSLNIAFSVLFMLTGQSMVSGGVMAQEPDPNFFIFLGIGQSNMQGKGGIESQDTGNTTSFMKKSWARYFKMVVVDSDASKVGTWVTAKPPIVRPDTGLGVTDYFGRTLVKGLDEKYKIGVLVVAVDGCSVKAFSKDKSVCSSYLNDSQTGSWVTGAAAQYGNYPYGKLVEMAKTAQKSGVIKGIIYHQGETDVTDATESQGNAWLASVYELYSNLINDLGLSMDSVPFIAGEPLRQEAGGVCYSAIPWVDRIPEYFRLQSGKDIAYVASSEGLSGMDQYHFSSEGYRTIGKRYGDIMLPILMEQIAANATLIPADDKDDVIYDLLGRRLDAPQKGINIINGKKVVIR